MGKHFDNKNDLLSALRRQRLESETAMAATFTAYMMMSLLILHDEFGFGQKRAEKYTDAFYKMLNDHEDGRLSANDIRQQVIDKLGMVVEPPAIPEWALKKKM